MPKESKQTIDIEALLHWAYAKQCVDRVAATRFSPQGPSGDANVAMARVLALGCRVDTSSHAERVLGARAPDDAMTVHDAVLGMDEMWIDADGGVWTRHGAAMAGLAIDRISGAFWLRGADGDKPLDCAYLAGLIIPHAKGATRPECHIGWVAPRGRPAQRQREEDGLGWRRKAGASIPREEVTHHRALYVAWHAALSYLAAVLADELSDYAPTPPAAPAAPWLSVRHGKDFLIPGKSIDHTPLKTKKKKRI